MKKRINKSKKSKPRKIDGLSPDDLKKIHKAVRQVWSWSYPWRLAKKRALRPDGFYECESLWCSQAGQPVPKVFVDHVKPVGKVGGPDYIARMFIPSSQLQCLCKRCHDEKTRDERKALAAIQEIDSWAS